MTIKAELEELIRTFQTTGRDFAEKAFLVEGPAAAVDRDRARSLVYERLQPSLSDPTKVGVLVALAQEALVGEVLKGFSERLQQLR